MSSTNANTSHMDDYHRTGSLGCFNPETFGNDYQIKRIIGEGSYGKVYEASQVSNGRKVAIKKIPKTEVTSLAEVSLLETFSFFLLKYLFLKFIPVIASHCIERQLFKIYLTVSICTLKI